MGDKSSGMFAMEGPILLATYVATLRCSRCSPRSRSESAWPLPGGASPFLQQSRCRP